MNDATQMKCDKPNSELIEEVKMEMKNIKSSARNKKRKTKNHFARSYRRFPCCNAIIFQPIRGKR
jgi:hypothetical protein